VDPTDRSNTPSPYRTTRHHKTQRLKQQQQQQQQHGAAAPSTTHHVVELLEHFVVRGPNGKHVCMVFEVLGCNLLSIIRQTRYRGLPLAAVKSITRQVCQVSTSIQ
jgi:hypothetical protein